MNYKTFEFTQIIKTIIVCVTFKHIILKVTNKSIIQCYALLSVSHTYFCLFMHVHKTFYCSFANKIQVSMTKRDSDARNIQEAPQFDCCRLYSQSQYQ
jgi:hypothetical protein